LTLAIEIWGKRLEILKKPFLRQPRPILGMREGWEGSFGQFLRDAADRAGISLISVLPQNGLYRDRARPSLRWRSNGRTRCDQREGDLYANRQLIAELTRKNRVPAMSRTADYVDAGG